MSPPNVTTPPGWGGVEGETVEAGHLKHQFSAGSSNEPVGRVVQFRRLIGRAIWRASYATQEARQRYAVRDQGRRQAGARIALWILRLLGKV